MYIPHTKYNIHIFYTSFFPARNLLYDKFFRIFIQQTIFSYMTMEKASDILIRKNGSWHSLRGAKVRSAGEWKSFGEGCGVFRSGKWYVLGSLSTAVTVYISFSVAEEEDGSMFWRITAGTEPDVLSSYLSDVYVEGTVMTSDSSTYSVSLTFSGEETSLSTGIPYREGVDILSHSLSAGAVTEGYHVTQTVVL